MANNHQVSIVLSSSVSTSPTPMAAAGRSKPSRRRQPPRDNHRDHCLCRDDDIIDDDVIDGEIGTKGSLPFALNCLSPSLLSISHLFTTTTIQLPAPRSSSLPQSLDLPQSLNPSIPRSSSLPQSPKFPPSCDPLISRSLDLSILLPASTFRPFPLTQSRTPWSARSRRTTGKALKPSVCRARFKGDLNRRPLPRRVRSSSTPPPSTSRPANLWRFSESVLRL